MATTVPTLAQTVVTSGSNEVATGGGPEPPTTGQLWPRAT